MMTTVLIVEDEKEINDLVAYYLRNEHFTVLQCERAEEALALSENHEIDLAILDVMLPGMNGFDLCRKIREKHQYPIIMLTAKSEEIDKVEGLTLGADDYLTKPFRPLELVARVKAQLRRVNYYKQEEPSNYLTVGPLEMDLDRRRVFFHAKEILLTPLEFSILKLLMQHPDEVMSSEVIFREVWGENYYTNANNTIMVHIRHLRKKINDAGVHHDYIKTVWGVGYKIEN